MRLYNSATRKKEDFSPARQPVRMYSCGPTVNSDLHIGSARFFLFVDLLKRYLLYKGLSVKHVLNITDIDDKTLSSCRSDLKKYTDFYTERFLEDLSTLDILDADCYPRATENVDEIIRLAKELVAKGLAYERCHSVYFDISKFSGYGRLSGIDARTLMDGARVDHDDYAKDNPRDFAILKRATLFELKNGFFYKSPFGNVRPGWHIECAAISRKYLGEEIDIHLGGTDLLFPHHENENAMMESITGKSLAKFWVHCEHLILDGKKISEENCLTIRSLLPEYTPLQIRHYLLSKHYRQPFNFTMDGLRNSCNSLVRLQNFLMRIDSAGIAEDSSASLEEVVFLFRTKIVDALDDDLNIGRAMTALSAFVRKCNLYMKNHGLTKSQKQVLRDFMADMNSIFGFLETLPLEDSDVSELVRQRDEARRNKDWQLADRLREEIRKNGYDVADSNIASSIKRLKYQD